ncbi:ferritin-like domain-containing protein [Kitasatospora sp. NPDC088346]|uniref:ferritin-like domain-containing protein n=1 Tax=Kitasatospora sp. NPDC088346 TaxID=3364073 RepID=UPI00380BF160
MLSPTRRTVLFLGALTGVQLLCGCTDEHGPDAPTAEHHPDQDLPLRTRAVAATDALLAGYDTVLAGPGAAQGDLLRRQREEVAQHRSALAQGLPAATGATTTGATATAAASPTGSAPAPAPAPASGAAIGTVAALAAAERQTATDRLADLDAASPALARLLASVSAAGALHATRLGDTGPVGAPAASPVPSAPAAAPTPGTAPAASGAASGTPAPLPSAAAAGAQSALAAEHAAVYGYGVACAFLPVGRPRDDGRTDYLAHQARRDAWERLLRSGGTGPTAAAAGYRLPFAVKDQATAGQLAAHIETRLTTVYADVVGAGTGPVRLQAAGALRESVLRAARWGAAPSALPGLPAPADTSASPSLSGSPSASPSR